MSHVVAFRTNARKQANDRAAKEADEAAQVEARIKRLVAALPTQAAFDAWIDGFPAEYQSDMRRRFQRFCTFTRPRAAKAAAVGVPPSSLQATGAGQTGAIILTDGWSARDHDDVHDDAHDDVHG